MGIAIISNSPPPTHPSGERQPPWLLRRVAIDRLKERLLGVAAAPEKSGKKA